MAKLVLLWNCSLVQNGFVEKTGIYSEKVKNFTTIAMTYY
jgi:hypothetical protein